MLVKYFLAGFLAWATAVLLGAGVPWEGSSYDLLIYAGMIPLSALIVAVFIPVHLYTTINLAAKEMYKITTFARTTQTFATVLFFLMWTLILYGVGSARMATAWLVIVTLIAGIAIHMGMSRYRVDRPVRIRVPHLWLKTLCHFVLFVLFSGCVFIERIYDEFGIDLEVVSSLMFVIAIVLILTYDYWQWDKPPCQVLRAGG